jgi:hypothetical protein
LPAHFYFVRPELAQGHGGNGQVYVDPEGSPMTMFGHFPDNVKSEQEGADADGAVAVTKHTVIRLHPGWHPLWQNQHCHTRAAPAPA